MSVSLRAQFHPPKSGSAFSPGRTTRKFGRFCSAVTIAACHFPASVSSEVSGPGRANCVRQLTVRTRIVCSTAGMLVLIVTMLLLLSSVLTISWLDRNALR